MAATARGADRAAPSVRAFHITQLDARIHVDGKLDEAAWNQLEPETGFVQTEPDEGAPATERTEVRIFYDNDKIYFGIKCFDSEPQKIAAWRDARDVRMQSDSVAIFLDPFGDRRTGYVFTIHAGGSQFDALLTEGAEPDSTWDGIWDSAVRIESWGWAAEVAIPFKSIRFTPGHMWGMNVRRDIARKNERAAWQLITRFDQRFRPAKAGTLEGIGNIEPGRNLELIPYFSTRARRGAPSITDNDEHYEGGLDLRWGLLPNATLNATINPDFADTETDEINISISRFELFFPEKRAFFNEGSNFYSTPMNLFFTRRVGARLPDGEGQRILFGTKLTGKLDGWSLGLLEARTQARHFFDPDTSTVKFASGANFFVLRMQRDIFRNSTIGFLTANRDQFRSLGGSGAGSTQRVHAFDMRITSAPSVQWSSQVAYNQNQYAPNGGIHRVAARSQFQYDSSAWEFRGRYKYVGRGFDVSDLGFEPETNRHSSQAAVQWKPYINKHGIRQLFFELNQDISLDTRGLLQDSGSDAGLNVRFKNFWSARVRYSYDRVRFNQFTAAPLCPPPYACRPAFDILARTRVYIEPRVRFILTSNDNRPVFFSYEYTRRKFAQFRENFYGRGETHSLQMTARMFGRTRVQFNGTIVREFLLDRAPFQNRRLFVARVHHQFTPKLRARILGQISGDRRGQNFNVNSIVGYDFTARSAFLVGYNYQRRAPLETTDLGHELFFKFSYLLHF